MMLAVACAVGDDEPDRLAAHALPAALRREHFWTPRRVKWALLYYEDIQAGKRPPRDPREPATGSRYFRWGWWERLADLRHDLNCALDWQRASDGRAAQVIELVYLSRRLEQHATQTRREIAAGERDVHWTTILRWEQRAIDDLAEHLGWERAGEEEAE